VASDFEALQMHELAARLQVKVTTWIGRTHPDLIAGDL
jgi:hypothetical protein